MKAIRRGESDARSERTGSRDKPARRMPLVPIAGATMLVAVIAVLELRTLGGHDRASEFADVAAEAPHVTVSAPAAPAPAEPQVTAAVAPISLDAQPRVSAEAPAADSAAVSVVPPKPAARRRPAETVKTPPAPSPPAVAEEPASQVAAAPARRAEAPRTDPLQSFNVALARCAREELMARVGCEQRVRLQYCGDSWGQIAQCSIGRPTDHGQ